MKVVRLRFYEELNDFLPTARKKEPFLHQFTGNPSVKDLIESLGVPHAEVDMILVNGSSVDFSYKPTDEDQISVYPVFESLDISEVTHLRRRPLRRLKFICDVHLGKMARNLRLLGFDTFFDRNIDDNEIINMSISEKRIILTRDRQLLKNNRITHGYWIRSSDPREQIREAVARFDLRNYLKPFSRCMDCNGLVQTVGKEEIIENLPPRTRKYYEEFYKCQVCGKVYWEGSHYSDMKKQIQNLLQ